MLRLVCALVDIHRQANVKQSRYLAAWLGHLMLDRFYAWLYFFARLFESAFSTNFLSVML
ncbi:MAG: hypothetical protein JSR44_00475 [Spirochaetes bacterium]|nr:hypothetical protein [Spirochaetota bacterium]